MEASKRATKKEREPQWEVRESIAMPRASLDELEIHAADGTSLRALVDDPSSEDYRGEMRGTLVLAHAMFARKSSFGRRDRPGLSRELTRLGFRTVAFDFRGHGDSKVTDYAYEDFVRLDLPAVVDCARARGEDKPVIVIGHSLGGHVACASQGTGRLGADAIVGVAANVWIRELERSQVRWAAKVAVAKTMLATAHRAGGFPARRLRVGSDDASERYLEDLFRGLMTGRGWRSRDGADDYLASLANVKVPVAAVLGDRDHMNCHPSCGEAFARRCSGPVAFFRAPVGHMGLVTDRVAWPRVIEAVEWAFLRSNESQSQTRP